MIGGIREKTNWHIAAIVVVVILCQFLPQLKGKVYKYAPIQGNRGNKVKVSPV